MAAGCVPVAINLGAQPEIVDNGVNGYCWDEPAELIEHTKQLIANKKLFSAMSRTALEKSKVYGIKRFEKTLINAVNSLA